MSKHVSESRVCTLLLGVNPAEIVGPLSIFQHTLACDKEEIKKLFQVLNRIAKIREEEDLVRALDKYWEDYEKPVLELIEADQNGSPEDNRTDREILEEILLLIRDLSKYLAIKKVNDDFFKATCQWGDDIKDHFDKINKRYFIQLSKDLSNNQGKLCEDKRDKNEEDDKTQN